MATTSGFISLGRFSLGADEHGTGPIADAFSETSRMGLRPLRIAKILWPG